jgi:hypothetical protein
MQRRGGSLTLYIQREAPEGGKEAKWIHAPAGKAEIIRVTMNNFQELN